MLSSFHPHHKWQHWTSEPVGKEFWENYANQRNFMDWLAPKLNVFRPKDWYTVTCNDIVQHGGQGLVAKYGNMDAILEELCPEFEMYPWLFHHLQKGFWTLKSNHLRYIEYIAKELHIATPESWYRVNRNELLERDGTSVLSMYEGSLCKALNSLYPEYTWHGWLFPVVPREFWMDSKNQLKYMDWVGEQLNIEKYEDWYLVQVKDLTDNHGGTLLWMHNHSVSALVMDSYPFYPWQPWKFSTAPQRFWDVLENQENYLQWFAETQQIKNPENWYSILLGTMYERGGRAIAAKYGNCVSRMMMTLYAEYEWLPWLFESSPQHLWDDKELHYRYFEWLSQKLDIKTPNDWYAAPIAQFPALRCNTYLGNHGGFMWKVMLTLFSEFNWKPWLFEPFPRTLFNNKEMVKSYLLWLSEQLCINDWQDWYNVNVDQVIQFRGSGLIFGYKGKFQEVVKSHFPSYPWRTNEFDISTKKTQSLLFRIVKKIIAQNTCILFDYMLPDDITPVELDIYIPSLKLAIEYQGEQHYKTTKMYGMHQPQQQRDQYKRQVCNKVGITLIEIGYWWKLDRNSIVEQITHARPDINLFLED